MLEAMDKRTGAIGAHCDESFRSNSLVDQSHDSILLLNTRPRAGLVIVIIAPFCYGCGVDELDRVVATPTGKMRCNCGLLRTSAFTARADIFVY